MFPESSDQARGEGRTSCTLPNDPHPWVVYVLLLWIIFEQRVLHFPFSVALQIHSWPYQWSSGSWGRYGSLFQRPCWIQEQGKTELKKNELTVNVCVCLFFNLQRVTISCIGQEAENCYKEPLVRGRKFIKIHQSWPLRTEKKTGWQACWGNQWLLFLGIH